MSPYQTRVGVAAWSKDEAIRIGFGLLKLSSDDSPAATDAHDRSAARFDQIENWDWACDLFSSTLRLSFLT